MSSFLSSFENDPWLVFRTVPRRAGLRIWPSTLAATVTCLLVSASAAVGPAGAQTPSARLVPAATLRLPGTVDSNSPAVWDLVGGRRVLTIMTSADGQPEIATGVSMTRMSQPAPVTFTSHPGDGVWMEAVVVDDAGTWYGYYHNEVPATTICNRPDRVMPRIGAARSVDRGRSWEDLGIILEAPPGWHACNSPNRYFVGGVGDVGVMLDHDATNLYLFFSQYSRFASAQGVAVARLPWASRDEPVGRADIRVRGVWQPADRVISDMDEAGNSREAWVYPSGTPLVRVERPWHDADRVNDAFWGASIHWNAFLQQYVMLLNRTKDEAFTSEGLYVSFAPSLDEPERWSRPQKILDGGTWYPQVMGIEPGDGSDRITGSIARFYVGGMSTAFIEFSYK